MLLFLANFVSILLVGLITFGMGGLSRSRQRTTKTVLVHLVPPVAAFVVVAIVLTGSLFRILESTRIGRSIQTTLANELAVKHGASLTDVVHTHTPNGVQVLATVRAQRTISPVWVTQMEEELEAAVSLPVDLVVRTMRSRDVSPLGSSLQVVQPDLNGHFLRSVASSNTSRETLASQVIREFYHEEPAFEITRVDYGGSEGEPSVIVAYVNAIRRFSHE